MPVIQGMLPAGVTKSEDVYKELARQEREAESEWSHKRYEWEEDYKIYDHIYSYKARVNDRDVFVINLCQVYYYQIYDKDEQIVCPKAYKSLKKCKKAAVKHAMKLPTKGEFVPGPDPETGEYKAGVTYKFEPLKEN